MEAIILVSAVAGMTWGVLCAWRGSLVTAALVLLLALCCFGYHFLHFPLGPLPLTIDRIVLALMLGMYVVQRRMGRADPKPLGWADWLLLAFLGYVGASIVLSDWQTVMKGDVSPWWRWIGGYLTPALIYWVVRQSRLDARQLRIVHGALSVFGVYLAVIAMLEMAGAWGLVFPTYIADPSVGLHFGRARGPMVQAVSFGHYLGVCLLAAYVWRPTLGRCGQCVLVSCVPLMLAGIFFSYTRSVWMGTAAGLVCVLLLTLPQAWRRLLIGGGVLATVLMLGTNLEALLGFQREQSAAETRESAGLRVSFAYVSWQMFLDRPVFGCGFGQFPKEKLAYLDDRQTELQLELLRPYVHHNTLLSLLTETGATGLGLYLGFMLLWAAQAWRLARNRELSVTMRRHGILTLGAIAVYAPQLVFHEMSYSALDNSLLMLLTGLTVGLARSGSRQAPDGFASAIESNRTALSPCSNTTPEGECPCEANVSGGSRLPLVEQSSVA